MKNITAVFAFLLSSLALFGQAATTLPAPAANGQTKTPVLKIETFNRDGQDWEQPSFVIGNKRIGVRALGTEFRTDQDHMINVIVDEERILSFRFWGSLGDAFGYPFESKAGTKPSLKIDEAAGTVTYSKPYLLPDGETATFSYTLKGLKESKVELSWDLGISQEALEAQPASFNGVSLWIALDGLADAGSARVSYRNTPITVNQQLLQPTEQNNLSEEDTSVLSGENGLDFQFSPEQPLQGFAFKLSDDHLFAAKELCRGEWDSLTFRVSSKQRLAHDSLIIDFGPVTD